MLCTFFIYYISDCYHEIKEKNDIVSIGTKLRFSCVNSPESAVCHVTGVDNGKHCVLKKS